MLLMNMRTETTQSPIEIPRIGLCNIFIDSHIKSIAMKLLILAIFHETRIAPVAI